MRVVAGRLLAIDIVVLLPAAVRACLTRLNTSLQPPPDGFRFNDRCLPHVTLVQQFAREDELTALFDAVNIVLSDTQPLELRTTTVAHGQTTSTLGLEQTSVLLDLHCRLMGRLAAFERDAGSVGSFHINGGPARTGDVEWVRNFRTKSAYVRFKPHITLGVGNLVSQIEPLAFTTPHVAACHLGRYCTCRVELAEWTLTTKTNP